MDLESHKYKQAEVQNCASRSPFSTDISNHAAPQFFCYSLEDVPFFEIYYLANKQNDDVRTSVFPDKSSPFQIL